jgi:hypothetical protein
MLSGRQKEGEAAGLDERKTPRDGAGRIGEILLVSRLITREQLREALDLQRELGGRLGFLLVDSGFVDQEDFAEVLALQLRLPLFSLVDYPFDPRVSSLLPRGSLEHHRMLPLQVEGARVTTAMADPLDELAQKELQEASGFHVRPVVATSSDILSSVAMVHKGLRQRSGLLGSLRELRKRDLGPADSGE